MESISGKKDSKYNVGDWVTIKSGLTGEVIGMAEYVWDWCYRIQFPNRKRTLYREEKTLKEA